MCRKLAVSAIFLAVAALLLSVIPPAQAYRICTFKGTVLDHGWRSMTVKSGNQCAEVNVGWRTKFLPNRRPCIGERIAVDFILEDGYMKATKIVSLTPMAASVQCYPPAPPSTAVCRTVEGDEGGGGGSSVEAPCASPRATCSNRPPAHVADPNWSPSRSRSERRASVERPSTRYTPRRARTPKKVATTQPTAKPAPKAETTKEDTQTNASASDDKKFKSIQGEVVASSPKSLSIKVTDESDTPEVMNLRVGLKTKFSPFRRPAVGEKVKVEYRHENGDKFGYSVKVVP